MYIISIEERNQRNEKDSFVYINNRILVDLVDLFLYTWYGYPQRRIDTNIFKQSKKIFPKTKQGLRA